MGGGVDQHQCCQCADGGRVRDPGRFGMTMLCPACSGQAAFETIEDPRVRMNLPSKFRDAAFAQWLPHDGRPRTGCQEYVAAWPPPAPLMFMTGGKGTGKTTLACAVLREAYDKHKVRGQFWPVIDLLDRYRRTFDADRAVETVDAIDSQMHRIQLLVLDDYGAHKGTDWAEERLFALIDYRYRETLPTVITSNVGLMEVADRVRSRLTDVGVCRIVNFAGPDMRPKAALSAGTRKAGAEA